MMVVHCQISAIVASTIAFVLSEATASAAGAAPVATLSVHEIWKIAERRQERIKNVHATYRYEWKLLESYPKETDRLGLEPYEVEFAYDGERRFQRKTPLRVDPRKLGEVRWVFDDGMTVELLADRTPAGAWRVKDAHLIPGKHHRVDNEELYPVEVLQIPLSDRTLAHLDTSRIYPHCIRPVDGAASSYKVLPAQDLVHGAWCHVLESPYDRIWVDPALQCAIRKREILDDGVVARYLMLELFEAFPEVFVPRKVLRQMLGRRSWPERYHGKVFLELRMDLLDISINQVTDDDFKVSIPAGCLVGDFRSGETYRIAREAEGEISELALESKKYLPSANAEWAPLLFLVNAGAVLMILVFVLWRRYRNRSVQPT
ncbi:MAG TPA: hypothetical protein VMV69_08550 [Pirellulales bacterium]|nr:hypothetical protein [Pirellulales bacterium]